jgi:hypothetical protein
MQKSSFGDLAIRMPGKSNQSRPLRFAAVPQKVCHRLGSDIHKSAFITPRFAQSFSFESWNLHPEDRTGWTFTLALPIVARYIS